MDRVTEQPEVVALRAEVARLKEELMAARKAKRGVVLPRKPFTGLGLFILGLFPALGVYILTVWLNQFPLFSRAYVLAVGISVASCIVMSFAIKGATRGEDYDERLRDMIADWIWLGDLSQPKPPPRARHPHFEDRPYPQKRTEALAWGALGKARIEEVEALAREIFPKGSSDITVVWGFPGVAHLERWKKHTLALAIFDKRDRAERLIELGHTMPALSFQPDKIYLTCPVVYCPEAPPSE